MKGALLVEVGGQPFALPLSAVREVFRAASPMALPRAPFGCLGLLDVRGEPTPMLDLAALLALRTHGRLRDDLEALLECHIVLSRVHEVPVALVVHRVLEVASEVEAEEHVEPQLLAPLGKAAGVVRGLVQVGTQRALLLGLEALISPRRAGLLDTARRAPVAQVHP